MRYVYVVCNLINWKVYVGQTISPARRKAGHFCAAKKGDDYPLPRAMRKHGPENFVFQVLEECTDDQVDEREKFWIAHFDSTSRERGYNLSRGGRSTSDETHRKLSEALKGNKHCVGRKQAPEWLAKRTATRRKRFQGKWNSPESLAHRSRTVVECGTFAGQNNPMHGRRGANHPTSKLTQEQADEIYRRVHAGETTRSLAAEFNVSRFTVSRIGRRILYAQAERV